MSDVGLPDPLGIFGEPTDLLGRKQKQSGAAPATTPAAIMAAAPVMPTPNDENVRRQRRRSTAQQRARSGRASTIFTEGYGLGG
jgi:hypothetical protein